MFGGITALCCGKMNTPYSEILYGTARNFLSQAKLSVTGRNFMSHEETSCHGKKLPVKGRHLLAQEETLCHRKKHPVT
jgi:hypothetical protein